MSVLVRAAAQLTPEAFLETWYHIFRYLLARSLKKWFTFRMRISLHTSYIHPSLNPLRANANLICHSITCTAGAGISTCCPSTTPLGLALGPDLPRADQLYPGNLRYSAERILTFLSLLIPAFSLQNTPRLLPVPLRRVFNAPLPITLVIPWLRWCVSAPDIFGAGPLD